MGCNSSKSAEAARDAARAASGKQPVMLPAGVVAAQASSTLHKDQRGGDSAPKPVLLGHLGRASPKGGASLKKGEEHLFPTTPVSYYIGHQDSGPDTPRDRAEAYDRSRSLQDYTSLATMELYAYSGMPLW
eukprot:TRINITY_DN25984_c0_g1_i1.p2 TRINITY_DN25984_c0_g1~~TRINITY_DN25984_c0_g1_i1.p2  ORF type:complete len:131 (+),score=24.91 TRINITY_DN25984_c0_g1_i1:102-494(+)